MTVGNPRTRRTSREAGIVSLLSGLNPDLAPVLNGNPARGLVYRDFAARANPRFVWARHCRVVADVLERVARRELRRVMIFMPPRHGKSEQVSKMFPAHVLHEHPDEWCAITSYGAALSLDFSRAARRYFESAGDIGGDTRAMTQWETGQGGGLWAVGVGGAAVGKGFHVGVIDDPVKDSKAAHSAVTSEANIEWYRGVFYTRQQPGAAIILAMTRWSLYDLAAFLIDAESNSDDREGWHFVVLPAIYEGPPEWIPEGCTFEPDWRKPGEALWPERYPLETLARIRETVGSHVWQAQYQQWPVPREGSMLKWAWLPDVDADPTDVLGRVRYWDLAGTEGGGDYTASVLMAIDTRGTVWIEDAVRGQWGLARRDDEIERTALEDRRYYGHVLTVGFERDMGMGGTDRTNALIRRLSGFKCFTDTATRSKELRFEPFVAQAEAGNVRLVAGDWNHDYRRELCDFPHGKHDHWVDATSGAYNHLAEMTHRRSTRISTVGLLGY